MTNQAPNRNQEQSISQRLKRRLVNVFQSVNLSIRRRILVDYIVIYIFVCIVTLVFVPFWFVYVEVDNEAYRQMDELNGLMNAHSQGIYSTKQLDYKIQQVAAVKDISLQVEIRRTDDSGLETAVIRTGMLTQIDFPNNIVEKAGLMFQELAITKKVGELNLANQATDYNYKVYAIYPIVTFSRQLLGLEMILIVFQFIGIFFIVIVSGNRIKKILSPIYYMTLSAERISIDNMDMRLDIEATKYELRELAITLNNMVDRLDKEYEKQKRFVSDVSHELRTPISIISGYSAMLKRWGKKDQAILEESIGAIVSEVNNMQILVENLLTLVRSDNKSLVFDKQDFDIGQLLEQSVQAFRLISGEHQTINYTPTDPLIVQMDPVRIKQVIRIILDNAIKYTDSTGVIDVFLERQAEHFSINIMDNGIGIERKDLPYLFERFYRSDISRTRQSGGNGLGLSIAKVIVLGHQGIIKVRSKVGKGSWFIIQFPYSDLNQKNKVEQG